MSNKIKMLFVQNNTNNLLVLKLTKLFIHPIRSMEPVLVMRHLHKEFGSKSFEPGAEMKQQNTGTICQKEQLLRI